MPLKILIVEDDAVVGLEFREAIAAAGYEVLGPVRSAAAGLLLAQLNAPDLAVIDVVLAGSTDGIQGARLLQREFELPIIFVSARSEQAIRARVRHLKPAAYLEKPCSTRMLLAAIEQAIGPGRQTTAPGKTQV
jgi:DNA-binding response OmpR family regulator